MKGKTENLQKNLKEQIYKKEGVFVKRDIHIQPKIDKVK